METIHPLRPYLFALLYHTLFHLSRVFLFFSINFLIWLNSTNKSGYFVESDNIFTRLRFVGSDTDCNYINEENFSIRSVSFPTITSQR